MPNFPTSLDALANPTSTTLRNDPGFSLAAAVSTLNDIAEALEAKLGIGASTPGAAAGVLRRTAAGASAWGQLAAADLSGGAMPQLIDTTGVLGAPLTIVQFLSISQAYKHLELRIFGRSTAAAVTDTVTLRYNADASAIYHGQVVQANAATITAFEHPVASTSALLGYVPAATSGAPAAFAAITVSIPGYSSTTGYKRLTSTAGYETNNSAGLSLVNLLSMTWYGTSAVTRLDIALAAAQWAAGTIISLYGYN